MQKIIKNNFSWWDLIKSFHYLSGDQWTRYIVFLTPLFIINFYSVIPPFVLGKIVDFFSSYRQGSSLYTFYFYAFFLGISFSLVSYIRLTLKKILGNIRTDIIYNINVKGFDHLLSLSWMDSRKEVAGEKAQKLNNGTQAFQVLSEQINNEIFQGLSSTIGIALIFAYLNIHYLMFLIIYLLGFFSIIKFYYSRIQKVKYAYNKASEKGGGSYVEGLGNILTIKTLGAKQSFNSRIASKEALKKKFEYLGRKYGIGQWISFQIFNGICIAVYLFIVGRDVVSGAISLGSIVIFYGYLEKLTDNAGQILRVYEQTISAKISLARMMPIFWSNFKNQDGNIDFPQQWDKIELKSVSFDYNKELSSTSKLVGLNNINFMIKHNEHVGIVGQTGSGKSTMAKLLVGLFPLNSGTYKIDNLNFYDIKSDAISNNIALVLQDAEIFNLSLRENITMMRQAGINDLERAIKIAHLQEVIDKLPDGLETILGEKGHRLSGGERQRIGIARAIYRNPQIIIFDEATSSLDIKTEKIIRSNLEKHLGSKTTIWITHRVATLENSDRIYVFEEGKLTEVGSYQNLIDRG